MCARKSAGPTVSTIAVAKNLSKHEILNFFGLNAGTKNHHNNLIVFSFT